MHAVNGIFVLRIHNQMWLERLVIGVDGASEGSSN